jgi:hypothetical protein
LTVASKAKPKPFTADMKAKLKAAAAALSVAAPDVAKGEGKTYEAWVLLEIARRVSNGISVTARDHTGALTTHFRVRGGPGFIPAVEAPPGQPCHFLLDGPKDTAELHSGLRHRGISTDTHELDISVLDDAVADYIRHHGGGPVDDWGPEHGAWLGVELKEYGSGTTLPKGYARALLGVANDLDHWGWVQIGPGRRLEAHNPIPIIFFLLTTAKLGSSQAFTDHWDLNGRSDVRPGNEGALDEVAQRILGRLT